MTSNTTARDACLFVGNGFVGDIGGDSFVFGTAGYQDITVLDQAGVVTFDATFNRGGDVIRLSGNAASWNVAISGSNATLAHGSTIVVIPVGTVGATLAFADGARTLRFEDGAVRIGEQVVTRTVAALSATSQGLITESELEGASSGRLILAAGAEAGIGGNVSVVGTSGTEVVSASRGAITFDATFNTGGDQVKIASSASAMTGAVSGSNAVLASSSLSVAIPLGTAGITLTMADGSRTLRYEALLESTLFGSQTLGRTAAALEASADSANDQVLFWHQALLDVVVAARTAPTFTSRAMGIMGVAIHDAVHGVTDGEALWIEQASSGSTDIDAAIAYAARTVLAALFPAQLALIDARLALALPDLGSGASLDNGRIYGVAIADAVLALRATDGFNAAATQPDGDAPGEWVRTPPAFAAAEAPQWAQLDPFVLTANDQFRAPAPLALTSAEYALQLAEVQTLGAVGSTVRTADQTEIALFWRDGPGTYTPPGHMIQIGLIAARETGTSTAQNVTIFATLDVALADAAVAAWDIKYTYDYWRPITAIREAETDGNDATIEDQSWTPLFATPSHPTYVSGHSTFSSAGAAVLEAYFGADFEFSVTSTGLVGVTRSYDSFAEAAMEAGRSRIYGGIHFEQDNVNGLTTGTSVGEWAVTVFTQLHDDTAVTLAASSSTVLG